MVRKGNSHLNEKANKNVIKYFKDDFNSLFLRSSLRVHRFREELFSVDSLICNSE